MARLIKTMLDRLGFNRSIFFERARDLLEWEKAGWIGLLLIDERLSDASGREVVSAIRTNGTALKQDLPIILCAHVDDAEMVFDARDRGVTEICLKPIHVTNFYKKLRLSLEQPRAFVQHETYVGPDRRRRHDRSYAGPERRATSYDQADVDRMMSS